MVTHALLMLAAIAAPPVQRTEEPLPAKGPALTITGVVRNADGEVVQGANVVLRAKIGGTFYAMGLDHNRDVLARTVTDDEGRFSLPRIGVPPRLTEQIAELQRGEAGAELIAWAEGHALAWTDVRQFEPEPVELTLQPEADVEGTVRDADGKPIPGVVLRLTGGTSPGNDFDSFFREPGDFNLSLSQVHIVARSDTDGRFVFPHLPAAMWLGVVVNHPGHEPRFWLLDTKTGSDLTEVPSRHGGATTVLQAPYTLTLEPAPAMLVRVVNHDGRPVTGGGLEVIDNERHGIGRGTLDDGGLARVRLPKAGKYQALYFSDPLQPTLHGSVTINIEDPAKPPEATIHLPAARTLAGRVVDAETGEGIAGAYVFYRHVEEGEPEGFSTSSPAVSDADGEFRLPVVPGKGMLRINRPLHGYFHTGKPTPVDVASSGELKPITLKVTRGRAVRGTVVDAEGAPAAGVTVRCEQEDRTRRLHSGQTTTDRDGRFELSGFAPDSDCTLLAYGKQGAAIEQVPANELADVDAATHWATVKITLQAGVVMTGRLMHDGQPRSGVSVRLHRTMGENRNRFYAFGPEWTDKEGRYRFAGLQSGDRYFFEIRDPDGLRATDWRQQSPYVSTTPKGPIVELEDAHLIEHDQTLRGRVVDPMGKGVPDVMVSARLANGGSLSRPVSGPAPWTKTDREGRFELRQLPNQPVALMAYREKPEGGPIRFPAKAQPKMNARDIRMVLDPRLTDEVDDLDAPKR